MKESGRSSKKSQKTAGTLGPLSRLVSGGAALEAFSNSERAILRRTRKRKRRPLNLIYIGTDTWRADHLGCYGNTWIKTPYVDKLAGEGIVFTNVYADDLPTIPCRRVLYTGKSIIPVWDFGGWRPLFAEDVTLAETLALQESTTALIADCYHFFKPDMNLHRGFLSWQWIRGQEFDPWKSGPPGGFDTRDYLPKHLWGDKQNPAVLQYLLNTQDIRTEADYFCARTCRAAMRWLERNRDNKPFVLWLEMFDPHEPWDAPRRFQEMYYDKYPVDRFIYGYGIDNSKLAPDDLDAIRGLYSAEVTFADMWIGELLQRVADLGFLDDTVIAFSTDHGTHLGEQGCIQKTPGLLNSLVAQVPLIIRHPDTSTYAGKRVDALISIMDYMPTFLDLLDAEPLSEMDGTSFWPLVNGEIERIRDELYTGFGVFGAVRTTKWHYFENVLRIGTPRSKNAEKHPLFTPALARQKGCGPCLYDVQSDPAETKNVFRKHPDVVADMRRRLARRFGLRVKK